MAKRECLKADPGYEEQFRAAFVLRADLCGNPIWEMAFEYAATHKLWPDELAAIGPALVRRLVLK